MTQRTLALHPQHGTQLSLDVSLNSFYCKQQMPTGPGLNLQDNWPSQSLRSAPEDQTKLQPRFRTSSGLSQYLSVPLFCFPPSCSYLERFSPGECGEGDF